MKTATLLVPSMLVLSAVALSGCVHGSTQPVQPAQPDLGLRVKNAITVDGLQFRDADGDGRLAPYEDWRLSAKERATDLAGRMTQAEKVGTLMHSTMPGLGGELGRADSYDLEALGDLVDDKHITSYITRLTLAPAQLAEQNNLAQEVAAAGRLGIPLTISTDPRNHFSYVLGAAEDGSGTTQWPELLGFAALGDPALVREFGEIARREYRALGIHMALSPQLDLLTEPRWPRGSGTFGSRADLSSELGGAYVEAFQGSAVGLQPDGVMTVVKHWVGYGAQPEGFEAHNYYGRFADPGDYLEEHIAAFDGALNARTAGIMPAYSLMESTELRALEPNEFGDLLAGIFSPLAFLWLVLGFFQQGQELRASVKALELQGRELQYSVEQQRQLVEVTREQLTFQSQALAHEQEELDRASQPILELSCTGNSGAGVPDIRRHSFRLANFGRQATDIRVTDVASMEPLHRAGLLETGDFASFKMDLPTAGFETHLIRAGYVDARGLQRSQSFIVSIENGAVTCGPEPD